ncbi:hypothetical protein LX16_0075 [Stackebrandtia albiflava]|uniref:D-alanyl-D-alanine carboxypeptidase-like protein n=1 Tax=Stackebrandtia albiflava TaxID=406432 RepID=A0A562VGZ9_9ACTN|nr:hypothetical protein [Stackebrandtia albiflava]TWJ17159.1 hypothetical protein LX16_0075 [Stackebrandtia albiflava]
MYRRFHHALWTVLAAVVTVAVPATAHAAPVKLTHAEAVEMFRAHDIAIWSSDGCSDRHNPRCTSFAQINLDTVRGAVTLTEYSGCALTVTGGTETGHGPSGLHTHWDGWKLDMSLTTCLATYIDRNFAYIGGDRWKSPAGNVYYREPDHWDVLYYNCGGCDDTESAVRGTGG